MIGPAAAEAAFAMLNETLGDLRRDYPHVHKMLLASRGRGFPTGTLGSGPTGKGVVSRPTERAAEMPDVAQHDLDETRRLIAVMAAAAMDLDRIRRQWYPQGIDRRPVCGNPGGCPSNKRGAAGRRAADGSPRCEACWRYSKRHDGQERPNARSAAA